LPSLILDIHIRAIAEGGVQVDHDIIGAVAEGGDDEGPETKTVKSIIKFFVKL